MRHVRSGSHRSSTKIALSNALCCCCLILAVSLAIPATRAEELEDVEEGEEEHISL
jgi:hypothetical protein